MLHLLFSQILYEATGQQGMKRLLKQIWDKMNEPRNERVLIVLLPCLALLAAALILTPRLVYFAKDSLAKEVEELNIPPLPTNTPEVLTLIPSTENEIFVETPTGIPTETFAPLEETVEEDDGTGWITVDGKTYYLDKNYTHAIGPEYIDGKLYYFDQNGVKASKLGIDVSFYNHGINWEAVKAQGIDFAILRAGGRGWESGLIYDDECFVRNLIAARKAGIDVGVYFYSTAITRAEAIQEAQYVIDLLKGTKLEYPIFIDVEQSGDYPRGRSDSLSKAERFDTIQAFCSTVRSAGYEAGIYSAVYFLLENMYQPSVSEYYVWLANYTRNNRLPSYSGNYDMWQFTDSGYVNGVRGKLDMNVIF